MSMQVMEDFFGRSLFQLGGTARVGPRHYLRTDHFLVDIDYSQEISAIWTVKFLIGDYFTFDAGALVVYSEGAIPVVGANYLLSR